MAERFLVTYHVRAAAETVAARAQAIAVEQSVEMPLEAIEAPEILRDIVGEVADIADLGNGVFAVRIALATATIGGDAAQLLNMLFGNTSLHDDVVLADVEVPPELAARFGGPRHGIAGLRRRVAAADGRALTCSALKPQGLSADQLASLAARFADGGIDFIKDDHGLANQSYSRFAARLRACATALRGRTTHYVPSLSGSLDAMRTQIMLAREEGIDTVLIAPLLAGFSTMQALVAAFPDIAFLAHPSFGGASRIAPDLLIGKLFRLLGADAVIFPTHGGRFGYTPETCRRLAETARAPLPGLHPALPVPAGGMALARVSEILDFYGPDTMLLIGGSLLAARERLTAETAAFTSRVAAHRYR
jgi:S-methyl-5-thioribulose 1-phosphate isomerase